MYWYADCNKQINSNCAPSQDLGAAGHVADEQLHESDGTAGFEDDDTEAFTTDDSTWETCSSDDDIDGNGYSCTGGAPPSMLFAVLWLSPSHAAC